MVEQGLLAREDVDFNPYGPHYEQVSRLLSLVCEQLSQERDDDAVHYSEQLLDVLSKHGLSEDVMSKLKHSSHDRDSVLSTAKHVIESPAGSQVNMPSGTKRRRGYFTDQHIFVLTEILVKHSHMWFEIGVALNLPLNLLKNIRSSYLTKPDLCVPEIISEWVSCKHEHAKPPTLESLKEALRSRLVKLVNVANSLDELLQEKGVYLEPNPLHICILGLLASRLCKRGQCDETTMSSY